MDVSVLIGSIGVGLLLLAFFLNLFNIVTQEKPLYSLLNMIGAGLACYASYLIGFIPFVVLEATWVVVATIGLLKIIRKK